MLLVAPVGVGETVELTQSDLFSLPDWQDKSVAIGGFFLGMTRAQALALAKANRLTLGSNMPARAVREINGLCRQASCFLAEGNGNWIGVDLFFDANRLTKMAVSVPVDVDSEIKKVNIARTFKGLTYEFFNHYSDALRERILGPVESKETLIKVGNDASALSFLEFDYPGCGVVVHVTIDRRDRPRELFDLEVDFVAQTRAVADSGVHDNH